MTNPIFEHLAPGPQRDEAEYEARMATARETIARLERERDEARAGLAEERAFRAALASELANTRRQLAGFRCDALADGLGALERRIAEADAKHPRDAGDGVWASVNTLENNLRMAREDLRREPTWAHALLCEMREVFVELGRGNLERIADELLDVATVAMRWRRDVLERGAR